MRWWLLNRAPEVRRTLLFVTVAVTPILFLRSTNDPINVPKLGFLIVMFAVVATLRAAEIIEGAGRSSLRRLAWPAGAFALALLIGWIASPYKGWALFGQYGRFQGLIPYLVIIGTGVLIADAFRREDLPRLAWAFVIGGAVVGLYGLMQVFGLDPLEWVLEARTTDATSTVGNPNFVGGLLAISMPLLILLWMQDAERRMFVVGAGLLIVGGWLASKSQGAWAAGVAGSAVALGYYAVDRWKAARVAGFAFALLVAVAAVGAVLVSALREPDISSSPGTAELRAYGWKAAVGMAADAPVFGKGPNAFSLQGVHYRSEKDAIGFTGRFPDDPHSVPLALLDGAGIFGIGAFFFTMGWAAKRAWSRTDIVTGAFAGAVVAYLVQALVSIDEVSLRLFLWAALAGLACATETAVEPATAPKPRGKKGKKKEGRNAPLRYPLAVGALAIPLLFALWWGLRFVYADAQMHWGLDRISGGDVDGGAATVDSALAVRSDANYRWRYGTALGDVAIEEQDPARLQQAEAAFGYLDDVPHLAGFVSLGRVLDDAAEFEPEAEERSRAAYAEAIEIDPLNPLLRVEYADVLNDLERYEEAEEILQPAIDIAGDEFAEVWGALAIARINLGDEEGAREAMERAFLIDPSEPQARAVEEALQGEQEGS